MRKNAPKDSFGQYVAVTGILALLKILKTISTPLVKSNAGNSALAAAEPLRQWELLSLRHMREILSSTPELIAVHAESTFRLLNSSGKEQMNR